MLYITHPITETEANILIVPVRLDGKIPTDSLHWKVIEKVGAEYEMDFTTELHANRINPGDPGLYTAAGGLVLVSFPYMESDGEEVQLSDIVTQMKEVISYTQYFPNCYTIAVPPIGKNYLWENIETLCRKLEDMNSGVAEFWLYPEEETWEMEDEEQQTIPETKVEVLTGIPLD